MLKVIDLFCGAGGISEGLRQAGFQIIHAVDKDRAAVETFRNNHPEAKVERLDVSSFDLDQLPEFDVLVGGPPCIEFSASKQGRGNILEGLRLVQAYLRVVYERKPKYWIMENVPRIVMHLPEEIPLTWIGVDKTGSLHVPVRAEFNTADFGIPQARRRFLMGSFPIPVPSHSDPASFPLLRTLEGRGSWRTLGEALELLPDPLAKPPSGDVRDPNYDLKIRCRSFTDHFHDVVLKRDEASRIRMVKTAHPYMGAMCFPDDSARPARTVVATQLGRETLVIRAKNGQEVFRRATVRECAVLQSFPITYQFFGESLNARYRLVGDAVPPMLTYGIGCGILRLEGMNPPAAPLVRETPVSISSPVPYRPRRVRSQFSLNRKFRALVPGKDVRGCRVEFDNLGENPRTAQFLPNKFRHMVEWTARLHLGEGKHNMKSRVFSLQEALHEISGYCRARENYERVIYFLESIIKDLQGELCDASTLQAAWVGLKDDIAGPESIVGKLSALIDTHFPKLEFHDERSPRSGTFEMIPAKGLRIRLAAALVGTAYACELINGDSGWVERNPQKRFIVEGWPCPSDRLKGGRKEWLSPLRLFEQEMGRRLDGLFAHHARASSFTRKASNVRGG